MGNCGIHCTIAALSRVRLMSIERKKEATEYACDASESVTYPEHHASKRRNAEMQK
jgi:hypothetical protein